MNKFINVTTEEYHDDKVGLKVPTLNYSTAKLINTKSPLHAWLEHPKGGGQKRPPKKQMNMGQILHAMLLSKGAKAQICEYKDWRTDKAKAEKEQALSAGLIPLLPKEYDEVIQASTTVTQQLAEQEIKLEGRTEQPMIWEEEGVACRGCMDLYVPPLAHPDRAGEITELKFTEWPLTESSIRRLIRSMSYDIQLATYVGGVHVITGEKPAFRWIFCEMLPPYQIRVVRPTDLMLQVGAQKWDRARNAWKECLASGKWTGYGAPLEIDPDFFELREFEISVYPQTEVIGDPEYVEPDNSEMWF